MAKCDLHLLDLLPLKLINSYTCYMKLNQSVYI